MSELIDVADEDRIKVHELCQKQLGSIWCKVSVNQLIIKRFGKGYVNKLFYCKLPDDVVEKYENRIVVVKISVNSEEYKFVDPIKSMINSLVLSEKKVAPKVLKIFNGGIITEFIQSRSFTGNDDHNKVIVSLLAQKLAKFHSIEMPIPKDGTQSFWDMVFNIWFYEDLRQSLTNGKVRKTIQSQNREILSKLDLFEEFVWVKNAILSGKFPITFAHCDFNRGNILIREESSNHNLDIFLIDFDYSCYNYRGIDFGRYFSSWGHKDPMFGFEDFPTDDQMSVFIDAYIEESIKLFSNSYAKILENSRENIIKEAKLFTLFCYLIDVLFCIWMVISDNTKAEEYLEKGETRFRGYHILKKQFQKQNALPFGYN